MKNMKLDDLLEIISDNDSCYHMRIHKNQDYIFFGDLDSYRKDISDFYEKLINFLKDYYDISITK